MTKPIRNHSDQAVAKLVDRYRGLPVFEAWVRSHVSGKQSLEDAAQALLAAFDLDSADYARLLILARIVGQPPLSDQEELRAAIRVRILVNRSRGTIPDLLEIAAFVFGGPARLAELEPIGIRLESVPATEIGTVAASLLREAKAAGVPISVITSATAATNRFRYSDVATGRRSAANTGFSDVSHTGGGKLSGVS